MEVTGYFLSLSVCILSSGKLAHLLDLCRVNSVGNCAVLGFWLHHSYACGDRVEVVIVGFCPGR